MDEGAVYDLFSVTGKRALVNAGLQGRDNLFGVAEAGHVRGAIIPVDGGNPGRLRERPR